MGNERNTQRNHRLGNCAQSAFTAWPAHWSALKCFQGGKLNTQGCKLEAIPNPKTHILTRLEWETKNITSGFVLYRAFFRCRQIFFFDKWRREHKKVAAVIWEAPRVRQLWEKCVQRAWMASAVQRTLNKQRKEKKRSNGGEDSGDVSTEKAVEDLCHSDCLQCLRPWIQIQSKQGGKQKFNHGNKTLWDDRNKAGFPSDLNGIGSDFNKRVGHSGDSYQSTNWSFQHSMKCCSKCII